MLNKLGLSGDEMKGFSKGFFPSVLSLKVYSYEMNFRIDRVGTYFEIARGRLDFPSFFVFFFLFEW